MQNSNTKQVNLIFNFLVSENSDHKAKIEEIYENSFKNACDNGCYDDSLLENEIRDNFIKTYFSINK